MKYKAICNDCRYEFTFDDLLMVSHLCDGRKYGPFDAVPILTIEENE